MYDTLEVETRGPFRGPRSYSAHDALPIKPQMQVLKIVLQADNEVVGVARDDHVASGLLLSPAIGPEVEDVVLKGVPRSLSANVTPSWIVGPFTAHYSARSR